MAPISLKSRVCTNLQQKKCANGAMVYIFSLKLKAGSLFAMIIMCMRSFSQLSPKLPVHRPRVCCQHYRATLEPCICIIVKTPEKKRRDHGARLRQNDLTAQCIIARKLNQPCYKSIAMNKSRNLYIHSCNQKRLRIQGFFTFLEM